jgi:hypothetical protein
MAMLTAFLERVIPDSTKVNPACIKNTSIPDKSIHNIPISPSTEAVSWMIRGMLVNNELIIII